MSISNASGRVLTSQSVLFLCWRKIAIGSAAVALLTVGLSSTAVATQGQGNGPKPKVWTVGTWNGKAGQFQSIQAAVDAASPGDWIVIAPGDYKERGDYTTHPPKIEPSAGVYIDKPDLHLLGLDRNRVIVDGTKSGPPCSSSASDQDRGPVGPSGPWGRNGIEVFEVSGVTIQNLTVCNFLSGQGGAGNEIWWNGGDGTGKIHMHDYSGSYLSATTAYYQKTDPAQGTYGIFVSNADGPGLIDWTYASNMNDSGYYIGACQDCNAVLEHAHGQNNVLGYSGTNSGGHLTIRNGEWDHNGEGIDTNSASSGDLPAPQNGACPAGTNADGSNSCWIVTGNYIHDNNNRNVPGNGLGLVGAGIVIAGGSHDTVTNNWFENNGAWAVALVPYVSGVQNSPADCTSGGGVWDNAFVDSLAGGPACFFNDFGSNVHDNVFVGNGSFNQPTNGDLADLSDFSLVGLPAATPGEGNCWHNNTDPAGVSSAPPNLQQTNGNCATAGPGAAVTDPLFGQVLCNLHQLPPSDPLCNGAVYPQQSPSFPLLPLPPQVSMPDPCSALPKHIPWCSPGHNKD
jgi:hypothetical protein